MEGDCTHNPEDWNKKSIKWKVRGDFLGPPRSTDKTTLIIKVSKGALTWLNFIKLQRNDL